MAGNEWTDELKAKIIEEYEASNPTPENTIELVKALGEKYKQAPNGVRMVLSKAGVYIRKEVASASKSSTTGGTKRVSKADAIDSLKSAIEKAGKAVDEDICDRLTGKAATYFTTLLS